VLTADLHAQALLKRIAHGYDPRLLKGKLYYNRKPFLRLKFSVPLPDGVDYHFPGGEGAEPVTVSFAAWMVKDGNGGYKALEDPVTSKAVKPAVETEKVKRRKVLITAAFRSEMADEYALNDENGNIRARRRRSRTYGRTDVRRRRTRTSSRIVVRRTGRSVVVSSTTNDGTLLRCRSDGPTVRTYRNRTERRTTVTDG